MAEPQFASPSDPMAPDLETRRRRFNDFEQLAYSRSPPLPDTLEEFWTDIPLADSWLSRTLVVRPKPVTIDSFAQYPRITTSRTPKRPIIIHFHGGSFTTGSPLQLSHPARLFAYQLNATVICPSYRLAPEHLWPAAIKDGMELVQAISSQPQLLFGANPSHGFILAGVSSGAVVAAVVAGLVSNQPTEFPISRPLTGAYISIPILFTDTIVPSEYRDVWTSRQDNSQSEYPNVSAMVREIGCTDSDVTSPWFSPINLFTGDGSSSAKFPPTYLQATGLDPVRDDATVFEKMLAASGIPTKIHVFPDDGHDTLSCFNLVFEPKSRNPTISEGTMEGIAWLLRKDWQNG